MPMTDEEARYVARRFREEGKERTPEQVRALNDSAMDKLRQALLEGGCGEHTDDELDDLLRYMYANELLP